MTSPLIELHNVSKSFGTQRVLRHVNWQIGEGQVIGLLGRNGAGKSTLLECMLGLRELNSGSVTIAGEPVEQLSSGTRASIGYVPQKSDAFEWLTPDQMLAYFRALYPHWNHDKVGALLDRWGFNTRMRTSPISQLSGGEKQRLAIIRALAHDPGLLVLDEPVSALDPAGRRDFLRELIDSVIEHATTVVFSTHILTDLERIAVDLAFLREGQLVMQGGLDALLEGARRIVGPRSALAALHIPGELRRSVAPDGSISVVAQLDAERMAQLAGKHPALRIESMNLEDLFVEVTQ